MEKILSALHAAAYLGESRLVERMIASGASVDEPDELGRTPLMFAASSGHTKVVDLLLRKGANPETKNLSGKTALDYALGNGWEEVISVLIEGKFIHKVII